MEINRGRSCHASLVNIPVAVSIVGFDSSSVFVGKQKEAFHGRRKKPT
jgi:hypothetical protein